MSRLQHGFDVRSRVNSESGRSKQKLIVSANDENRVALEPPTVSGDGARLQFSAGIRLTYKLEQSFRADTRRKGLTCLARGDSLFPILRRRAERHMAGTFTANL